MKRLDQTGGQEVKERKRDRWAQGEREGKGRREGENNDNSSPTANAVTKTSDIN